MNTDEINKFLNDSSNEVLIRAQIRRLEKLAVFFNIPNWKSITIGTLAQEVTRKLEELRKIMEREP